MRIVERRDVLLILVIGVIATAVWYFGQVTRLPLPALLWTLEGAHAGSVTSVVFSPDGKVLVSAGIDQTIKLWNTDSGTCSRTLTGHVFPIKALAFSPRGRLLAAGGGRGVGEIRLWDVELGQEVAVLVGPGGSIERMSEVHSLAFSPDGKFLASGSSTVVYLWDVDSRQPIAILHDGAGDIQSVAYSADGRTLASGGSVGMYGGVIVLWDCHSLTKTTTFQESGTITSLAFSPNGSVLASASAFRDIHLREVPSGKTVYFDHDEAGKHIPAIAFCPDGTMIVWGTSVGTIRVLSLDQRKATASVEGHKASVRTVACSPDGHILASGDENGSICLWQFPVK